MFFSQEHFWGFIITLIIVTIVGISAARKVKTAKDFTVGGYRSSATLVAGTIVGTIVGGASTIGTAQLAFTVGLAAWWFTLGAGIALFFMAFIYAETLRRARLQTIPEYLSLNYGVSASWIAGLSSSVGIFFSIVANILSALPLVIAIFNFDSVQSAWLVFFLIVVYVLFGGVWGTGMVGVLKTVLIYVTIIAVGWVSYSKIGGYTGFTAAFPSYPWFSLFGRGFWVDFGSALSLLVGTLSTQTYIQAICGAKEVKTAKRGAILAALVTLPSGIPAVMVGLFMKAHHPDIAPISALPLFILYYLPPWFGGIAMAALLMAAVGSCAGLALGVGTMLSYDILDRITGRFSGRAALWLDRSLVLAVALAATLFTFGNLKSLVLEWNFLSMGLRGAGVFLPLTAAVLWPGKFNKAIALWSMAGGAGVALAWKFIFPRGVDPLYAGLITCAALLLLAYFKRPADKMPKPD